MRNLHPRTSVAWLQPICQSTRGMHFRLRANWDSSPHAGSGCSRIHVFARGKLSYAGVSTEKIESHARQMAVDARSELAGFIAALDADFKPTALRVKEGRAAGVIVDAADEAGADIVVVGTHGRTGIAKFLIGERDRRNHVALGARYPGRSSAAAGWVTWPCLRCKCRAPRGLPVHCSARFAPGFLPLSG